MTSHNQFSLQDLGIVQITLDSQVQSRVENDPAVVQEYVDAFSDQDIDVPPIVVFHDGTTYLLADGFHRIEAFKRLGRTTIACRVFPGGLRDAVLYSLGANAEHGLRRMPADKRKAVLKMLNDPEWGSWSDREIAARCKVSRPFVANLRSSLVNVSSERSFVNKHGGVSVMNTGRIGQKGNQPQEASDQLTEGPSPPEPEYTEIDQLNDQIAELGNLVKELNEENERLRDVIAIGQWDATEIEKLEVEEPRRPPKLLHLWPLKIPHPLS